MIPVCVTHKPKRWPMAYSNPSRQICYYACLFSFSPDEHTKVPSLNRLSSPRLGRNRLQFVFQVFFFPLSLVLPFSSYLLQLHIVGSFGSHTAFKCIYTDPASSQRMKHVLPHSSSLNSDRHPPQLRCCNLPSCYFHLLLHISLKVHVCARSGCKLKITDHTMSRATSVARSKDESDYAKQNKTLQRKN